MKNRKPVLILCGLLLASLTIIGCSMFGTNPGPPTKAESLVFNTITNTVLVTNLVTQAVPVYHTQEVTSVTYRTNEIAVPGQPPQLTVVTQTVIQPVITVEHTNYVPSQVVTTNTTYTETVKPAVATDVGYISTALNFFFPGVGSIAGNAILAGLGAWAYGRSNKQGNTTNVLAQEIETIREFIQALPNGHNYDTAFVNFLQAHQTDAGVINTVLATLSSKVSNPDAKVAAQQMIDTINALMAQQGGTTPPALIIPAVKLT